MKPGHACDKERYRKGRRACRQGQCLHGFNYSSFRSIATQTPLSDETALRAFAAGADLVPDDLFDVGCHWIYPSLSVAQRGLRSSGLAARAVANASEDAVYAAQEHALQPFRQADGSYAVPVTYRCLLARV